MANTEFFKESLKENSAINWKDILSESFVKHTREDREYAMQIGTSARLVPESKMLQAWHRPWLWWSAMKYGLGLIGVLYGAYFLCTLVFRATAQALVHMMMIIPPIVIPFVIMIFLWEMNVPQNISIMDLLAFFLAGGIICFVICSVFFLPFPSGLSASYAALREEPGKLGAAIAILLYLERVQKKKIYGITGLVVGAAVGAAFSGIESVSYAINSSSNTIGMIINQVMRGLFALGGHITYCVPYATAIALNAKNGKLTSGSFINIMTLGAFAGSVALHALWNGTNLLVQIILVVVSAFILLFWIKKALREIVQICKSKQNRDHVNVGSETIMLRYQTPSQPGAFWKSSSGEILIGRQSDKCALCLGNDVKGVSRVHCKIVRKGNQWYVQDMNSTCGTYIGSRKLAAYEMYPIHSGDRIFLGSKKVNLMVV